MKATPDSPIQVTLLKPVIWIEYGIGGDRHIMVQYADDAPFEYAALFYRYGYTDNATIHRAATEIAVSIGATEPVEERHRHLSAEVERLAAQSAPLAQQAREYPPLPKLPTMTVLSELQSGTQEMVRLDVAHEAMRAYVDADRAAAHVEPPAGRVIPADGEVRS